MSVSISSNKGNGAPELVARIAGVMAGYRLPWCMCGGYAVDAWIGRETRDHGDLDVSVLVEDQRALFEHLRGWQLIAHDKGKLVPGNTSQLWDGQRRIESTGHIHARPASDDAIPEILGPQSGFWLDIQLNDGSTDEWIVSRAPLISVPMARAVAESPWRLPTATPEVLLFYKSKDLRRRDKLDFTRLLPQLSDEQRAWLRDAIERVAHPWVAELSGAPKDEAMV